MKLFLILCCLISGCTSLYPDYDIHFPTKPAPIEAAHNIEMHGDTSFTQTERTAIEDAATMWNNFSNNIVKFHIIWDLDFNSMSSLQEHQYDDLILRTDSKNNWLTDHTDNAQQKLLAMVEHDDASSMVNHSNSKSPQKMYLLVDRIAELSSQTVPSNELLTREAAHELGHILWLGHNTSSPYNLMYFAYYKDKFYPHCYFGKQDAEIFCRRYGCKIEEMMYCHD